jgi:hypothetical protein
MRFRLSPAQVEALLHELCGALGFCLPSDEQARLRESPPTDVDSFTNAVIRVEGLDPFVDIPLHLRRDLRTRVEEHFRMAEDNEPIDQLV